MTVIGRSLEQSGLLLAEIDFFAVASVPDRLTAEDRPQHCKGLAYATGKPL